MGIWAGEEGDGAANLFSDRVGVWELQLQTAGGRADVLHALQEASVP